jgi:RNA 2',3'-cyclic 3'-phosphodiesterase
LNVPPEGQSEAATRPARARLFFALWPSAEAAEQLAGIAGVTAADWGGKPTRRETIHLTLAFLGDVPESIIPGLVAVARRVQAAPFALQIDHLEFWQRQHLLWAGPSAVPAALNALAERLHVELAEAGFGLADARRSFVPHVTLVRKTPLESAPRQLPVISPIAWPVPGFVLVRSRLSAAGPDYQRIAEFPLVS